MKVLIYGAGNYCDLYLSNKKSSSDTILGIVDKNCDKWGLMKKEYVINSPDIIFKQQYDALIIAVADWESAVDKLLQKGCSIDNILIYHGERNEIYPFATIYEKYIENKIVKQNIIKQVKTSLLLESLFDGEYCEFDRVIVLGDNNDFCVIEEFFRNLNQNKIIISYQNNMHIYENDKVIFCKETYKKDLIDIRCQLKSERQWIILPFFDISNVVFLKGVLV